MWSSKVNFFSWLQTLASKENPATSAALVHTVTEPPAAFIPKLLTKAMTAPLTIKNFFKPVEGAGTSAKKPKPEPKSNLNKQETDVKQKSRQDFFKRTKSLEEQEVKGKVEANGLKEETEEICLIEEPEETKSASYVNEDSSETLEVTSDAKNITNDTENEDVVTDNKEDIMTNNNDTAAADTRGLKRPSGDSKMAPSSKKRKQDGIQSMFAKQIKKQETRSCPICGLQFKATALNVEINNHVDNCLIEWIQVRQVCTCAHQRLTMSVLGNLDLCIDFAWFYSILNSWCTL